MMIARTVAGLALMLMVPLAAHAADDPFLGTWRLNKLRSVIATDPGVKRKEIMFSPQAGGGVLITETLEMATEPTKHVSKLPYVYGKPTPQPGPELEALLVTKPDEHTQLWTAQAKGQIAAQLQVRLSDDGKTMTFRYLWNAGDPTGKAAGDRYVYERQ